MKRLLLLFLLAAGATAASADIIPSITTSTDVTPVTGGDFVWNYSATLTQDEDAVTHDYFTIYDFGGFAPGSNSQPAGWTFMASLLGKTPGLVRPTDSPLLYNPTWTYTESAPLIGSLDLGTFTAVSDTSMFRIGRFAAQATSNTGDLTGTKVDNIGSIAVPVPEMSRSSADDRLGRQRQSRRNALILSGTERDRELMDLQNRFGSSW